MSMKSTFGIDSIEDQHQESKESIQKFLELHNRHYKHQELFDSPRLFPVGKHSEVINIFVTFKAYFNPSWRVATSCLLET